MRKHEKAVRNALDKWDPDGNVLQHDAQNEVSLVLGGMAGGAAAAVATGKKNERF